MSQANRKRFEKISSYVEQWGVVAVLVAIAAPTVVSTLSSLNQLPIL